MTTKETSFVPGALDLTEQAIHLLRHTGLMALADYYIGTLPFILGLLFFWSDMSRNANAGWYCAPAAAGLAVLFIWMKFWHARFGRRLWCALNDSAPESWTWRRCWAAAARQALLHATGLVALTVAALIMLPLAWVYAFYQNLSVLDAPETDDLKSLYQSAVQQASLWPGQNHLLLTILSVFALFVMANVTVAVMLMPYLVKWLLGVETAFTISGLHALTNTTFLAILCALTYLGVDPIVKTAYTLRCFYGLSRHTGDDLRAALKPFLKAGVFILSAGLAFAPRAMAQNQPQAAAMAVEQAAQAQPYAEALDQTISEVLQERRFAWRLPRQKIQEAPSGEMGWLKRNLKWIGDQIQKAIKAIDQWLESVSEWLRKKLGDTQWDGSAGQDWRWVTRLLFMITGLMFILLLLIAIRRWLLVRQAARQKAEKTRGTPSIDINDETITAGDLPRDQWLHLAQELIAKMDFRQATRALYLATLAQLGEHHRVAIARYKSNRDYQMELARRVHAESELLTRFNQCVTAYERAWYGQHPVAEDQLARFKADQERIASLVQGAA
jgi:hypothetical protein